ncbi:MAG: ABC transporter permease [Phycisphaerales bacterium]|nr:MAG: ABC transporter permease [Phycisphaerales bacterium]
MSDVSSRRSAAGRGVEWVGRVAAGRLAAGAAFVRFVGGVSSLLGVTLAWFGRGLIRRRARAAPATFVRQMVRIGVESIGIVVLVQTFIGIILTLQLAPTLELYGQLERVADVVGIAVFRELGPLLTAIVISGFAGASIAAELGAMVEGEEIKALRAHALNPIRFLIVPRFVATVLMLTGLTVLADVVGVAGGLATSMTVLGVSFDTYMSLTREALTLSDFYTGLIKAGCFGAIVAMIASYEGLNVRGGAEGVGRATTQTVVKSIVALIGVDVIFTAVFFAFKV